MAEKTNKLYCKGKHEKLTTSQQWRTNARKRRYEKTKEHNLNSTIFRTRLVIPHMIFCLVYSNYLESGDCWDLLRIRSMLIWKMHTKMCI